MDDDRRGGGPAAEQDPEGGDARPFDQTNGVLGPDEDDERPGREVGGPPRTFGVPPMTSL